MSPWKPVKRRDFIKKLRKLGFQGPVYGKRHEVMIFHQKRLAIPSYAEYTVDKTKEIVREVETILGGEISMNEWNSL